jgi:NAD(P)H-dependent FMN reductase
MLRIAIIIGSTRPGRKAEAVAKWVYEIAQKRSDAEFELVDIKDFNLPLLDEPVPPIMGQYNQPHTKIWAVKMGSFDGYVFVTPEYNHGISGALKNAIDFLFAEWNNKAAGFVSYGGVGGARAVEQLRLMLAEVQIATVRNQSCSPCIPTLKTSASSSRLPSTRSLSMPCLTRSSLGAAR